MAALTSLNMWSDKPKGGESKAGKFMKKENNLFILKSGIAECKCKISDGRVMYGMKNGRWRNLPEDEVVKYKINGNKIIITEIFADGSRSSDLPPTPSRPGQGENI
jgi:hypothetical protein